ncbi:MAG: radical SAM protein, partial [Candidatus Omnitrophica bacterium]|nr:radical SAM protein [Candidatus Omnitrophota bacterium]
MRKSIRNISLSGGEPFLCKNLILIIKKIRKVSSRARIVISTNGILVDLIQTRMREILKIDPNTAIRVSLDGIGNIHNQIRGSPSAYNNVIRSIDLLKKLGVKDLGVQFTIINDNVDQLIPVYNLTKKLEINFICQVAHSSYFYFQADNPDIKQKDILIRELNCLIYSELKTFNLYKLFKTYYYRGMIDYLINSPKRKRCFAGSLFCYINTKGEIYPCIMLNEKMGDLRERGFSDIWQSKTANLAREKVKHCKKNCWLICTVAPIIKDNPFKALP